MKTPDFDDLLAAFDIPDMEAIESSPEEEQTQGEENDNDLPTVSVIVKNTVRTETHGVEKDKRAHNHIKTQDSPTGDSQLGNSGESDVPRVTNGLTETDSKESTQSSTDQPLQQITESTSTTSKMGAPCAQTHHSKEAEKMIKPLLQGPFATSGSVTKHHLVGSSSSCLPQSSQGNTSNTSSCQPVGASINDVIQSDDEASEADLGEPLVIQESVVSPETAVPSHYSESPERTSRSSHISNSPEPQLKVALTTQSAEAVQPHSPASIVKDEEYPEHVIDERDSPESPPPSETGRMVPKRRTSPEQLHTDEEQPMERESSEEHKERVTKERNTQVQKKSTNVSQSTETVSSSLCPVKLQKKTVMSNAPKKCGRGNTGAVNPLKTLSGSLDTRPKRGVLKQSKASLDTVTVKGAKLKMSSASGSITKTTAKALPTGITLQKLGQKPLTGGSRPASIVNSTGAIISKSQTNLVEAFNRVLNNKNLLPSYKPDLNSPRLAEWGLSLPAQGYRCLECGDSFALEQSLAQHYARRSLRIEVTCNHCAKRLAFFNKCSLLLHAREHKERGLIMQCSHLVMKPVPADQMMSQQEPAAAAPTSALCQTTSTTSTTSTTGTVKKTVQYCSNKCPECQTQFNSPEEVAEHFQELKATESSSCTDCSPPMLLSNSCCAAAHQRIHQGCPPHVCPECGGTAKQTVFKTHLDETCFHFARRIGYRCSSCLVVFGGSNSVKSHIQQAHCDMFHKCPTCPMAFKSAPSIQNHISVQHPTLKETQTMLIYKCVMCDTVFTHKTLLYVHFDTHLANQKVHVFKCPECTKLFSQKSSLIDHFKIHKTKIKHESPSPIALSHPQTPTKMESSEGEDWINQTKEVKLKKTLKKFPCTKCETSFTTTSNLRRHIRDKHKPGTRGFRCQYCSDVKKTFGSKAMLEKHIQLRHSLDTRDLDILMEGGDEADSSSEQDGGPGYRRRRRAVVKSEQEDESVNGSSPVKRSSSSAPPADSLPETGFRCAPCGFTCEDQGVFLEHISQHRKGTAAGSTQQCLQCGVCFTSTHSLSRHRFIVHKLRDPDNQDTPNVCPAPSPDGNLDDKSSAPASPALLQGQDGEGALNCKVCGKPFEKIADLNTHFRTHGMAFINARSTGKTT